MYSAGMKKLGADGFTWTEEHIDKWIADPKAMIPDSPMALAFAGMPDADAARRHHRLSEGAAVAVRRLGRFPSPLGRGLHAAILRARRT